MIKFNVAAINCCTEAEGPRKRLTIWFQGCNIHCPGCCNPDYQPLVVKNLISMEALIEIIIDAKEKYDIEGVTYSGGEPTLQKHLPQLTKAIHNLGLGVISFTGRLYDDVKEILTGCDMVLDGAYNASLPETKRRLLGSENQRILCLTDRYRLNIDWFFSSDCKLVEINVSDFIFANGDKI